MIGNPFLYRAADSRIGSMAEDRNFVNLFGVNALSLIEAKTPQIWNMPLLLSSSPGGGKSSLMRIFSPSVLRYVQDTAPRGGNQKQLSQKMEEIGFFKNGSPCVLGVWLRMSDEYQSFQQDEILTRQGFFCAIINARIILSALKGICILKNTTLSCISLAIKHEAQSITRQAWSKWGADAAAILYDNMSKLEADLCDMIDDPFWNGETATLTHSGLWSLDLLANLDLKINDITCSFRPLIMLDDVHELTEFQLKRNLN